MSGYKGMSAREWADAPDVSREAEREREIRYYAANDPADYTRQILRDLLGWLDDARRALEQAEWERDAVVNVMQKSADLCGEHISEVAEQARTFVVALGLLRPVTETDRNVAAVVAEHMVGETE